MERRTLLAVFLAFVVVYVYQAYIAPPASPAPTEQTSAAPTAVAGAALATAPAVPAAPVAAAAPGPSMVVGAEREETVTLETAQVRAVFTNRGGRLTNWVLKGYLDRTGKPVDLVASGLSIAQPLPLSIETDTPALTARLNDALLRTQVDDASKRVVFEGEDGDGVAIRKEFQLDPASFLLSVSVSARQGTQPLATGLVWGPGLGDLGATTGGGFFSRDTSRAPEALLQNGEDVERVSYSKVVEGSTARTGTYRFIGIDDHYFIVAALSTGPLTGTFKALSHAMPGQEGRERQLLSVVLRQQEPGKALKLYVGPKSFDVMKGIDGEFVRAINFGFWAWLAVPFLGVLKWIYGFAGNWGWAIILLTLLMNIVIFPLRHKTAVSMRKMQEVQPQMKAIQDRYAGLKATDPARQKMNAEIMALYKEKGANPVSGCLPTVLTFPVLFAFYSLLSEAIELRNAPFALWIQDLSTHDPYYVTPILMGVAMFWQQWMTPATGDPTQRRMMMFMPVMFTGMFLTLPSGLAIYYFVNTLWGIGQQYFTNWMLGPMAVQAPRPPAERRVKSVGSGKTEKVERKS
ncbi:MAG: membrane protein insertase YidC [Armatimonadota bacterium]|nr:membrane protein insertase YidC [Armatimonadota bacterium]